MTPAPGHGAKIERFKLELYADDGLCEFRMRLDLKTSRQHLAGGAVSLDPCGELAQ